MKLPRSAMDEEQAQLRQYLLGALPEEQAALLDERLFQGDQLSDDLQRRLEEELQDLVDEYARGELGTVERAQFLDQCGRSPELRKAAQDADLLVRGLRRRASPVPVKAATPFRHRVLMLLSPAVAAALCVVTVLALRQHQMPPPSHIQASIAPAAPLAGALAASPERFTAFLPANHVRGDEDEPRLVVPSHASAVELQVELRDRLPNSMLCDGSISESGHRIWSSVRIPVRQFGQVRFLDLLLSPEILAPGSYQLAYSCPGRPASAESRLFVVAGGRAEPASRTGSSR